MFLAQRICKGEISFALIRIDWSLAESFACRTTNRFGKSCSSDDLCADVADIARV